MGPLTPHSLPRPASANWLKGRYQGPKTWLDHAPPPQELRICDAPVFKSRLFVVQCGYRTRTTRIPARPQTKNLQSALSRRTWTALVRTLKLLSRNLGIDCLLSGERNERLFTGRRIWIFVGRLKCFPI